MRNSTSDIIVFIWLKGKGYVPAAKIIKHNDARSCLERSGSVCLNTFTRFLSGISALLTLPLSLATFVRRKSRQTFSCPTVNAAAFDCTNPCIP